MACTRAQAAAHKGPPSPASPASKHQGKQLEGKRAPRKRRRPPQEQLATKHKHNRPRLPTIAQKDQPTSAQSRGRKRKQSVEELEHDPDPDPARKRKRTNTRPGNNTLGEPATDAGAPTNATCPISFWAKEGYWPVEDISQTGTDMERLLARKKSSSLSRKRSNSATSTTPSDQKPREEKSAPYRDARYPLLLQTKGSHMGKSPLGITDESRHLCGNLLNSEQPVLKASLFDDDIFESVCDNLENKNEARVIQDVSRLIVPSAEQCALRAQHVDIKKVIESVNEGWNNSIPLTGTRPQPDYSAGFRREAFTNDQLAKMSPFIGDFITGDQSLFMATYYMYFPFLACEVKCGATALDIADRQNAHSMTLAVRAIVELFRAVRREDEVNRQILAFSISHDHTSVRIYGHYAVINGEGTTFYRHPIHKFSFTTLDGRDKWTAYRFTKNVYDIWMPAHFKKICSAIDQLPSNLDFDVSSFDEATGLSQDVGNLMQSDAGSASLPIEQDNQSSNVEQQGITPNTSFTGSKVGKRRKG